MNRSTIVVGSIYSLRERILQASMTLRDLDKDNLAEARTIAALLVNAALCLEASIRERSEEEEGLHHDTA